MFGCSEDRHHAGIESRVAEKLQKNGNWNYCGFHNANVGFILQKEEQIMSEATIFQLTPGALELEFATKLFGLSFAKCKLELLLQFGSKRIFLF
jgi:hypothetical protein